jgi:hypothetical protein
MQIRAFHKTIVNLEFIEALWQQLSGISLTLE